MAQLVKCPACGRDIWSDATSCKCGAGTRSSQPTVASQVRWPFKVLPFGVIVLFVLIAVAVPDSKERDQPASSRAEAGSRPAKTRLPPKAQFVKDLEAMIADGDL